MHETLVNGTCNDCSKFVAVFPADEKFADWGYCEAQNEAPPAAEVARLRASAIAGDRAPLRENLLGIFRMEPDDACDFFHDRDHDD
jgi:hypothetical protein